MKSFVAYPMDLDKILYPDASEISYSGKLLAHHELLKKVVHLEGSIVKCGISAETGFLRFASFRNLIGPESSQKVIAFEKLTKKMYYDTEENNVGTLTIKTKSQPINEELMQKKLTRKGITNKIEFIPGNLGDSIPDYLIENPELKISYLNIDLDDYEATLTTLQFFYPRLVHGGLVIFDNYYKLEEDYRAVIDYFNYSHVFIHNFSINKGPHYLVRQ